ncbi:MAG TPA: sialidase family protein, partial [Chloroflexota bacterium]|nr:sialidase family protein [Chloroflexota bacterium]
MRFPVIRAARVRVLVAVVIAALLAVAPSIVAFANVAVTRLSTDPYVNTSSQHKTEVEPDSLSYGSTIVTATQVGRFFDGGSSNIGWATSTNSGSTWTNGFLPGTTPYSTPPGPFARVSDPSVAYDASHNVWLIASLPLNSSVSGAGVIVNRSTDGGLTWGNPVVVSTITGTDKNWIVCDDTSTSAFFGHCYVEFDNNFQGNRILMSTSSDGGVTWGAATATANGATGLGGQPLVRPNGTVIVPIANAFETAILAFKSTNGGASWTAPVTVSPISRHNVAGGLRTGPLPSAEIDRAGRVYLVWQDCRFRSGCSSNDIVMTTSKNG